MPLDEEDRQRLEGVALDTARPDRLRLRALSLLRPARWHHLAVLVQMLREVEPGPLQYALGEELRSWIVKSATISNAPSASDREVIAAALPALDEGAQQQIEFVLRTTA
jgi:hypothetical protein